MRRRLFVLIVLAGIAVAWWLALPPSAGRLDPAEASGPGPAIRGAIHVHTIRSDGTGTIDEVAEAAARAGLQFVIVTDHGDATRAPDPPAYRHGVLSIDAVEISTDGGHVIALGVPRAPYPLAGEARDVVDDITRLGGLSIVAHPGSDRAGLRWVEWTAPFGALEWLNGDSEWRDERPLTFARALFAYPFRAAETLATLLDRPDTVLRRWDALTQRRRVVAVAAADAHARIGSRGPGEPFERAAVLRIPGYESIFRTFSISLPGLSLSGDAGDDAQAVIEAIRNGRVYSTIDALAGPVTMTFLATSGRYDAQAGDVLPLDGPVTLQVLTNAPQHARMTLLRNGVVAASGSGAALHHTAPAEPAVYRVEIHLPGAPGDPAVPWVVSNPIYAGHQLREERLPDPRGPATEMAVLYKDGLATGWSVEHSEGATGAFDTVSAGRGAQLRFEYALAGEATDSPFAALIAPAGPALSVYDRLMFTGRAAGPMRVSVQLRVHESGERWHRSVYLDEQPREVTVFFDDMTPRGVTTARRPALSKVEAVLFVVDTVNTAAGSRGTIWIDDVSYGR